MNSRAAGVAQGSLSGNLKRCYYAHKKLSPLHGPVFRMELGACQTLSRDGDTPQILALKATLIAPITR